MLVCFIWMLFNIWSKMCPPSTHCPGLFQMSLHFRAILPKSLLEIGFISKYGYGIFYFHFIFMFSIFTEKRETLIFVQMSVRVLFFFFISITRWAYIKWNWKSFLWFILWEVFVFGLYCIIRKLCLLLFRPHAQKRQFIYRMNGRTEHSPFPACSFYFALFFLSLSFLSLTWKFMA